MKKMLALMSAATLLFGIATMSMAQDKAGDSKMGGKMGDGKMSAKTAKTKAAIKTGPGTKPVTKTKPATKTVVKPKKPVVKATTSKMSDTKGKMSGDKKM